MIPQSIIPPRFLSSMNRSAFSLRENDHVLPFPPDSSGSPHKIPVPGPCRTPLLRPAVCLPAHSTGSAGVLPAGAFFSVSMANGSSLPISGYRCSTIVPSKSTAIIITVSGLKVPCRSGSAPFSGSCPSVRFLPSLPAHSSRQADNTAAGTLPVYSDTAAEKPGKSTARFDAAHPCDLVHRIIHVLQQQGSCVFHPHSFDQLLERLLFGVSPYGHAKILFVRSRISDRLIRFSPFRVKLWFFCRNSSSFRYVYCRMARLTSILFFPP